MKKIIFFDGDGTLWYPKKSKRARHPVWLYRDRRYKEHLNHLIMIPTVLSTLKKLKKKGIKTVVLSTHPHPPKEADALINQKVKHFKLEELFDEVHATKVHHSSKGKCILRILKKRKIPKSKAMMVGDSYKWDYHSAKLKGIDAILIESEYEPMVRTVKKTIKKLSDVLKYV